jgi:hypothetical protein
MFRRRAEVKEAGCRIAGAGVEAGYMCVLLDSATGSAQESAAPVPAPHGHKEGIKN